MSRRVPLLWVGMLLAGSVSKAAEDPALTQIRTLLETIRTKASGSLGATPEFTDVKHKLRDLVEGRLHTFRNEHEVRAFTNQLNEELRAAKLACASATSSVYDVCPNRGQLGYLGDITLTYGEMLVITTRVGLVCGFDESAYAYSFMNGAWRRLWQSETNNYAKGKYDPVNFLHILLSSRDYLNRGSDPNVRLLLVLSRQPAQCESNWYNVYYRVWQLRIDRPEENLLFDGGEEAFLGASVDGLVSPHDVLIEYSTHTTYTDFLVRPVVLHYVLRGGRLEREDPLAVSPRDFADEWMRTDWAVSSNWTSPGADAASLQSMHKPENFSGGTYTFTMYCENRPEHWQVDLVWEDFNGKTMVETKHVYLLVRWLPPYRFSMAGVSDHPWAGCTIKDPAADEPNTLFPVHLGQR